jgi:nuclear migration protein JNM1
MAAPSRLAALPGYDTAPDVYETPELTDDTSNTQHTAPSEVDDTTSTSATTDSENDSESESEGESGVVSRRRLRPSHARKKFTREGKGVEIKDGRFGDRVGGLGGRGYRVSQVSRREDNESLGEKVARLKREVEECRVLAEGANGEGAVGEGDMEGLRRVLEGLQTKKGRDERTRDGEKSLGLASLDGGAPETPLLPSLALLDRQFGALMNASSIASLEAASARIRKLKEEAEQLSQPSSESTAQLQSSGTTTPTSETAQHGMSPVDVEKLRALHNLLPTLQSLAPTVPALLDRLRSLHTLHAGAANAAGELDDVEKSQADFDKELKEWRQGLEKVEQAIRQADEANGRNGKFVKDWVNDVEARMSKLG